MMKNNFTIKAYENAYILLKLLPVKLYPSHLILLSEANFNVWVEILKSALKTLQTYCIGEMK